MSELNNKVAVITGAGSGIEKHRQSAKPTRG